MDGFMSPESKDEQIPIWITNEISRQLVHKWRAEEHAILVGTNTVLSDNPSLTVRDWTGQNPIRIVLDKDNKLSKDCNVFNKDAETIIISKRELDFNGNLAFKICSFLYKKDIQSVIIEGGSKTLQMFIDEGLWDETRVFTGKMTFGNGVKAPKFSGTLISEITVIDDRLKTFNND
jgi:diaminohydroxyphosphoribosylaminopyrimidine deaminase/5-amino-6-(5-phosphoribosylamino)uracil reductase